MKQNQKNNLMKMLEIVFLVGLLLLSSYFGWVINQSVNDEIIEERDKQILSLKSSLESLRNTKEEEIKQINQQYSEKVTELNDQIKRSNVLDFRPKIKTIKEFIRKDKTDVEKYDEFSFTCVDFTQTLVNNLLKEGIYACYTYLGFEDGGHAIVAVNTLDKGVIYIEPQDDTVIYSLEVGDNYCELAKWDCEWEIKKKVSCFDVV